jgi:uncharacterized membrane protein YfcA
MPADLSFSIEIASVALLAGAFGAIMGIGGGLILVPILITFFEVPTDVARLASLVAVCVTSVAGSYVYLREGVVDLVEASCLQLPTAAGAVVGALLGRALSEDVVRILFACFLVLTAVRMLRNGPAKNPSDAQKGAWAMAFTACLCAGIVSSVLGVGGGIVFVPVLALLLRKTPREAAATSTYLIGLTGAASALVYIQDHTSPQGQAALLAVTLPSALGILVGAQVGARVSRFIAGGQLRIAFAGVMLVNAGLLVWKVAHG